MNYELGELAANMHLAAKAIRDFDKAVFSCIPNSKQKHLALHGKNERIRKKKTQKSSKGAVHK